MSVYLLHQGQRKDTVLQTPYLTAVRVDSPTTNCQVGFLFVLCFETGFQTFISPPYHETAKSALT